IVSIGAARALTLGLFVGVSLCHHSVAWGPALSSVGGVQRNKQQPNKTSIRPRFGRTSAGQLSTSSSPRLEAAASSDQEQDKPTQPEAVVPKGDDVVEQATGWPPSEQQQQPPKKPQQPWWEDERRTQGLPTLTASTQWRMFLTLKDPTLGGDAGEATEVAVRVRFSEDRNFEPPQGSLEVIEDNPCFGQQAGKARWTLSEEEDKRGAGLWVWGLFEDPLYPFLLLQLDNLEIVSGGAKIPPGRLYVKVDHKRDDELGPTLNSGTVGVKLIER
ncbi:unnamed protein product, partial [Laminaria digitata]